MTAGVRRERLGLDALGLGLIAAMREHPRAGMLELSRPLRVARGTVESRVRRLAESGFVAGYGREINVEAVGFAVQAHVPIEIAKRRWRNSPLNLDPIPCLLEASATTGRTDGICRDAADSHEDLAADIAGARGSRYVVRPPA